MAKKDWSGIDLAIGAMITIGIGVVFNAIFSEATKRVIGSFPDWAVNIIFWVCLVLAVTLVYSLLLKIKKKK